MRYVLRNGESLISFCVTEAAFEENQFTPTAIRCGKKSMNHKLGLDLTSCIIIILLNVVLVTARTLSDCNTIHVTILVNVMRFEVFINFAA